MADKKAAGKPTPEQFDGFDGASEDRALRAGADALKVRHLVDPDHPLDLWILSPVTGHVYRLPLNLPLSSYMELASDDDLNSIDGFRRVIGTFYPEGADDLEDESPITIAAMLATYGRVFAKVQGMALGE